MRYVDRVAIAVCFHFVSRPLALLSQFSFCLLARGFGLFSRRGRSKKRGQKTEAMLNVFDISEDALILPVLQKSLRENYKQLNHQEIWSFSALFKQCLVARKRPKRKKPSQQPEDGCQVDLKARNMRPKSKQTAAKWAVIHRQTLCHGLFRSCKPIPFTSTLFFYHSVPSLE